MKCEEDKGGMEIQSARSEKGRLRDTESTLRLPSKPKLLWVHGWGMSSSVWRHLAEQLPEFEHRYVSYAGASTVLELLAAVRRPFEEEPEGEWHAIGWSMGGMLLLELLTEWREASDAGLNKAWEQEQGQEQVQKQEHGQDQKQVQERVIGRAGSMGDHVEAVRPPVVRSVILTGTTLRFIDDTGQAGWPDRVVRRMRRRLAQAAPADTLRVFAECIPAAAERASAESCRWLLEHTAALGKDITPAGLDAGLAYLQQADLERAWARLTDAPDGPRLYWLHGADDSVCPLAAQQRAQAACGHRNAARFVVLPHAGHAPFATQTAQWLNHIRMWCSASSKRSLFDDFQMEQGGEA
ncbi:pimeloyl-CoA synthesis protein [Paenibacillus alvei TS-15]|uniref:Pimeloyl-CoA synthesis protein n=2 Tax=Paenibacillus alvei TaxID=44250 RepID=S9SM08_PAEAL|nr:pimeloyl-CoA synthesis protein [Paenibacillus alvei TS-15]